MQAMMSWILLLLTVPMTAFGAGAFLYEISPQMVRLASAGWSARACDASTVFTNPSGMQRLPCSELVAGLEPFYLNIDFEPNSRTTIQGSHGNSNEWLPAAGLFYATPINSCWSIGVGSLGYFGSVLDYGNNWVGRYYITEASLQGFSGIISTSYQASDCLSLGLGYTVMYVPFEQKSAVRNLFDGGDDGRLKLKDHDFAQGFVVGALYEWSPCTRFGIQYLSEMKLHYRAKPHFKDVGPILSASLASGRLSIDPVHLDLNLPQSIMVGFYHTFDCFAVMGDIGWQQWSKFEKAEITLGGPADRSLTFATKYKNGWHAALGLEYCWSEDLLWSLGIAYDNSIVPKKQRSLSFPVGKQWRFGTGFSWDTICNSTLELTYELSWTGDLSITQNRGPLAGTVSGKFKNLCAHFINLGLKKVF